jgi:hypothetical protein
VEALVRALGFGPRDGEDATDLAGAAAALEQAGADIASARQEILEQLAKHEITADAAAAAIRGLGRGRA